MTTPRRNLRHALKSFVPNWLSEIPGFKVGFTILFVIALVCDLFVETILEGVFAAFPGLGTPTAIPYIAQSRGFIRGDGETDDSFTARLRAWLQTWPEAGSDELLARLVQGYLGGNLVVRVVDRRGHFTTIRADQSVIVEDDSNWNPDATGIPERVGWWSDLWIIVYLDSRWPVYTDLSDPAWTAAWGTYNGFGTGLQVPRNIQNDLGIILSTFKGAHSYIEWMVFTTDTSLFVPGALGATYPNGRWGYWSKDVGAGQVPARSTDSAGGVLRYFVPVSGG